MGCEEGRTNIIEINEEAKISYINFLSNCTTVYSVNVSESWGVCGSKYNVLTTWLSADNWSVTCCEFTSSCYNDIKADFSDTCDYNISQTSSFSWRYENGGWVGVCCDFVTGLCYDQPNVDILSNATCSYNYTQVTASIFQNDSLWNAWCCVSGGVE